MRLKLSDLRGLTENEQVERINAFMESAQNPSIEELKRQKKGVELEIKEYEKASGIKSEHLKDPWVKLMVNIPFAHEWTMALKRKELIDQAIQEVGKMTNETPRDYTKIETGVYYSDGDEIIVFSKKTRNKDYVLTDLGGLFCWACTDQKQEDIYLTQEFLVGLGINLFDDVFYIKYIKEPSEKDVAIFCQALLDVASLFISSMPEND